MGTRNLTCVVKDGEYKVAKYGQWDGYPSGLGKDILTFLKEKFNQDLLLKGLIGVQEVKTKAQAEKVWNDKANTGFPEYGFKDIPLADKFKFPRYQLSRDCSGDEYLEGLQNGWVKFHNPDLGFTKDSLFCEWCYVIDLDKQTFEVYKGFNKSPLTPKDRFYGDGKANNGGYYPVVLAKSWKLSKLPTQKALETLDKQDED